MNIFILTLISALSISVIGAYFSILGLSTIFPGAKLSVIIMGTVLEVGKLVTVLWLHKNWTRAKFLLKFYFCFAVFTLMGITSLGIFGFLSKSHIEHKQQASNEMTLIDNLEAKIKNQENSIIQFENAIKNLNQKEDKKVDIQQKEIDREQSKLKFISDNLQKNIKNENESIEKLISRKKELDQVRLEVEKKNSGIFSNKKKAMEEIDEAQKVERDEIDKNINICNDRINQYKKDYEIEYKKINNFIDDIRSKVFVETDVASKNEEYNQKIKKSLEEIEVLSKEKSELGKNLRAIESELGPLKYFIEIINDIGIASMSGGQAVRVIIIVIMLVFDPLAILLVIAAQQSFYNEKGRINSTYKKLKEKISKKDSPENPGLGEVLKKAEVKNPTKSVSIIDPEISATIKKEIH